MIRSYLLLYLFGISVCFLSTTVGREAILNGFSVLGDQLGYQVSVQIHGRGHVCGGGIIGNRFILTAAHCLLNRTRHLHSTHIFILAGANNLNSIDPLAIIVRVDKVFYPSEYHPTAHLSVGDIAVLMLARTLQLEHNPNLQRVDFPRNYDHHTGDLIAGFGWNEHYNGIIRSDGNLHMAAINALSNDECEKAFPHGAIHSDIHFCAKIHPFDSRHDNNRYGVCNGDDGGLLINYYGRTVVGVLSRFASHCDERREPAIYIRVVHYLNMILNVMEHGSDPQMISLRT